MPARNGSARRAVATVAAGLAVLNAAALIAVKTALPGLDLVPDGPAQAAPQRPDRAVDAAPVAQGPLPAETAARTVLDAVAEALPGAVRQKSLANGFPVAEPCRTSQAPAPAVAVSGGWAGNGALVTVTVAAWGAGQGPEAFDGFRAAYRACGGTTGRPGTGHESFGARALGTVIGAARRADMAVVVGWRGTGPGPAALLRVLDPVLERALAGRCADPGPGSPGPDGGQRNPWHDGYQPWQEAVAVSLPATAPAAAPPSPLPSAPGLLDETGGFEPAPPFPTDWLPAPSSSPTTTPSPLPSPPVPPSVPARPERPIEPSPPAPVPQQTVIRVLSADTAGPGCGWAFTGQAPVETDPDAIRRAADTARARAQDGLAAAAEAWEGLDTAYRLAYATYAEQARAWNAWAEQVRATRISYDEQVRDYVAQFPPSPAPEPTPEPEPSPPPSAAPPSPSAAPSPGPASPSPAPSPQPGPGKGGASPSPSPSPSRPAQEDAASANG